MQSPITPLPASPEMGLMSADALQKPLYEAVSTEEVTAFIREFHDSSNSRACNGIIDQLLGLDRGDIEQHIKKANRPYARYPGEQIWEGGAEVIWTPYTQIRDMVKGLDLSPNDVFYDLGSGYGRVALYTAITSPATVKGVELVPERAQKAVAAGKRLGLSAEFTIGNVLDQDYSDATVFYAYSPFSEATFKHILEILRQLATRKPITVAAKLDRHFLAQDWLKPVNYDREVPINIFTSLPPEDITEPQLHMF